MNKVQLVYGVCVFLSISLSPAAQYEFSGTVLDDSSSPIANALVRVSDMSGPSAFKHAARTDTNGIYQLSASFSVGTTVTVHAARSSVFVWSREIVLGTNEALSNLDFFIPTANTANVSVKGSITVGGNPPQENASVIVQMNQATNGQKLVGMFLVAAAGLQRTNAYEFADMPLGEYTVSAQADSSSWTQAVVIVTATNTPIQLDFNF
jgi:hypothetical protein